LRVLGIDVADAFADRIAMGPEEVGHGAIDDDDLLRVRTVSRGEVTPPGQGNAKRREIARSDPLVEGEGLLPLFPCNPLNDEIAAVREAEDRH
jgi:hypothetical protein